MVLTRREAIERVVAENPNFAVADMQVQGVPWRVYRNTPRSLVEILRRTESFGERTFLVYRKQRWTFAEHLQVVAGLAHRWKSWGVERGDRVAVAMRNYPEWVMSFWAAMALGAVVVPLNAWWTGDELIYGLNDSQAKLLVLDGERAERLADRRREVGVERIVAVRAGQAVPGGMVSWEDQLSESDPGAGIPEVDVEPDGDATIIYTSGTTGVPKGAIGTHRNHLTNIRNMELSGAVGLMMAGLAAPQNPRQPSMLQTYPFFHIGGISGLYSNTAMGAKMSLMYKWDSAEAVELIHRESVTSVALVPTLLRRFLDYLAERGLEFESVGAMGSGGAPVPADLIRQVGQQFSGRVSPANGYGLTETTSAVTSNSGPEYLRHPDSVGRLVPVADMRVVDPETKNDVAGGAVGELWFRGPNVVRGYWNKPAETAEAFTDGWFHTGDLGWIDDEGLVYVVDRLKDVIIRGGENVYCAEIEGSLFEHPAVADVAVIGLPHESWGEQVVAIVEPRPDAQVSEGDLQRHVAAHLAEFKVPSRIVLTAEPLPRTATGKVLKRELRERFLQGD